MPVSLKLQGECKNASCEWFSIIQCLEIKNDKGHVGHICKNLIKIRLFMHTNILPLCTTYTNVDYTTMYANVHQCPSMYTNVHQCTPLYTIVHHCTSLYTIVHQCTPITKGMSAMLVQNTKEYKKTSITT